VLRTLPRAVDRLLVNVVLAGARAAWPLLRRVPASWLRPLLALRARRLRRSLVGSLLAPSLALVTAGVLLALFR
jgi:hypothetical protein